MSIEREREPWWRCRCKHALYDHSARRHESQSGLTYHRCNVPGCKCEEWVNAANQDWYDGSLRQLYEAVS